MKYYRDFHHLSSFARRAFAASSILPSRNRLVLPVILFSALSGVGGTMSFAAASDTSLDEVRVEFFEKKVRPILVGHCYQCHSADTKPAGGLRMDDRNGLLLGGDSGPAVVPGDPSKSLLLERIKSENGKRQMPKEGDMLTEAEVADLTTWIENGAAWPRERIPASIGRTRPQYESLKASHWAWQPLREPAVPLVRDEAWPAGDVDRFILASLEAKQLAPVADADAITLIRRVTFDLTGLPPTPAEVEAYTKNPTPDAYAQWVDHLLASPRFGERWGRHWLDVARYGESTGPSRNIPYPHAWKYRDYVIDSINQDLPYNRFIVEQIAGDLLPARDDAERDRLLTATGFLALGVKDVNQRFKTRFLMDNVDEQIDAVTRSVIALTVSCARCHDHKFDPIPVTDYYALAGIFTSTDDCAGVRNKMGGGGLDYYVPTMLLRLSSDLPPPPAEQVEKLQVEVAEAKKAWDEIRGTPEGLKIAADGRPTQRPVRLRYEKLQGELLAITDPAARGQAVHGARDGKTIADTEVRIRGEAERLGPMVPRGFLTTFAVADAAPINPAQSGRLELAQWLTNPNNPLSPRVAVNRIWQHLFGAGLVTTVDNFGVKGDVPSHPELLDHLALEFVRDGWSLKKLVRSLVLTRTYRLGVDTSQAHTEIDPSNRLLWRHSPRRLDAEEIRDTILATAGRLHLGSPVPSPVNELRMVEIRDNGNEARRLHEQADRSQLRSVYLPLLRGVIPKALADFDPVTQSLVTGKRDETTVPTQALYLLNSTFIRQQSLALAEVLLADDSRSADEKVREVYLRIVGRAPTTYEVARAAEFLSAYALTWEQTEPAPATDTTQPLVAGSFGTSATAEPESNAQASAPIGAADLKAVIAAPINPDDVDRTNELVAEASVEPKSAESAAWMSLIQALYGSAEFRYVR